ncbi:transmembrane protein 225B isoform X2 [Marmota flaviventris]|uniref:transmembrane protein 225B isoform X2 n=1 Tax=Marmota flaviventris TaxID=93162 RepID=UPI003A8362F2
MDKPHLCAMRSACISTVIISFTLSHGRMWRSPTSAITFPLHRVSSSSPGSSSPAVYILLGRFFLISAVILAFLTIFLTVSSASELFPRTWKHSVVSATVSFLTGICAFLAMLLHALEIRDLRMKPSPPQFSMQWPYYILGFDILLFLVAGAICLSQGKICLRCRLLPIYQSTEDVQGTLHLEKLESLGGKLSWVQKETHLREATVI